MKDEAENGSIRTRAGDWCMVTDALMVGGLPRTDDGGRGGAKGSCKEKGTTERADEAATHKGRLPRVPHRSNGEDSRVGVARPPWRSQSGRRQFLLPLLVLDRLSALSSTQLTTEQRRHAIQSVREAAAAINGFMVRDTD